MISFHFVDVSSIQSSVDRSNFSESNLDRLADLILDGGGLVKPLILKQTEIDKYSVVDGNFEYYAAVRVKEKDRDRGEMVNAFVISAKEEAKIIEQIQALQTSKNTSNSEATQTKNSTTNHLESRLNNLELRLEKQNNELRSEYKQEIKKLEDKFDRLNSLIPQPNNPLTLLNQLNETELTVKLQRSKIRGADKIAKNIVASRKKKSQQKFENYSDVVTSVSGLGDKTIVTIIDDWS